MEESEVAQRDDMIKSGKDLLLKFKKKRSKESLNQSASSSQQSSQSDLSTTSQSQLDSEAPPPQQVQPLLENTGHPLPPTPQPISLQTSASFDAAPRSPVSPNLSSQRIRKDAKITPSIDRLEAGLSSNESLSTAPEPPTQAPPIGTIPNPFLSSENLVAEESPQPERAVVVASTEPPAVPPRSPTSRPPTRPTSASPQSEFTSRPLPSVPQPSQSPPSLPAKQNMAQVSLQAGLKPYKAPKPTGTHRSPSPASQFVAIKPAPEETRSTSRSPSLRKLGRPTSPQKAPPPPPRSPSRPSSQPSSEQQSPMRGRSTAPSPALGAVMPSAITERLAQLDQELKAKQLENERLKAAVERSQVTQREASLNLEAERQVRESQEAQMQALRKLGETHQRDAEREMNARKQAEENFRKAQASVDHSSQVLEQRNQELHKCQQMISELRHQVTHQQQTVQEKELGQMAIIEQMRVDMQRIQQENSTLKSQLEQAQQQQNHMTESQSSSIQKVEEENRRLRKRVEKAKSEYDNVAEQVVQIRENVANEIGVLKNSLEEKNSKISELEKRLEESQIAVETNTPDTEQVQEFEKQLRDAHKRVEVLNSKIGEKDRELNHLQEQLRIAQQELQIKKSNLELSLSNHQQRESKLEAQIKSMMQTIEKLTSEKLGLESRVLGLQKEATPNPQKNVQVEYDRLKGEFEVMKEFYRIKYGERHDMPYDLTPTENSNLYKKEIESWKSKYIESCIKITDLVREKRKLLFEVETLNQKLQQAVHSQSQNVLRVRESQVETLQQEVTSQENRIKVLMKIITKLTNLNWEQEQQLQEISNPKTGSAKREEVNQESFREKTSSSAQYSSRTNLSTSKEILKSESNGRLAWSISGHPYDSEPSIAQEVLDEIAASKRRQQAKY